MSLIWCWSLRPKYLSSCLNEYSVFILLRKDVLDFCCPPVISRMICLKFASVLFPFLSNYPWPLFYVEKPQTSALVTKGLLTIQLNYLLYFVKSLFTVHFSKKHVQSISLFTCRCFTAVSFGKKHFLSTHNLVIFSCLLTS